jgi:hypothetical protein
LLVSKKLIPKINSINHNNEKSEAKDAFLEMKIVVHQIMK